MATKAGSFNQAITFKVYPQAHKKADGTNTIYLRVTIERKKKEINLHVYWPVEFFDMERQCALPRFAKDRDVQGVNMVIDEARGKANRIKLRYFVDNKSLTPEQFVKEFESYESRDNFLFYWKNKVEQDYNTGIITHQTWKGYNTNINLLDEYSGGKGFLNMNEIDSEFIKKYFSWLTKRRTPKELKYNTALKAIKSIQTYFNKAKEDGFTLNENVFAKAPKSYRAGERAVLEQDELQKLKDLYAKDNLPEVGQEVLRKFLFSCYTGLRISDSAQLSSQMIKNNVLRVRMKKGERYGKEVSIKLPDYAQELIKGRKGLLFTPIADPLCNRWLKSIAAAVDLDKRLTFHVSRDTYATLFIELGGDVGTLKELMGHSSIHTTQIYMKMSEKRAEKLMDNFNKL